MNTLEVLCEVFLFFFFIIRYCSGKLGKMSGFKRMQSKVFWGQMAAHDHEEAPLIHGLAANGAAATAILGQLSNAYCNLAMNSEDSEESVRGSDESNSNVTVIRVSEENSVLDHESTERKRFRNETLDESR